MKIFEIRERKDEELVTLSRQLHEDMYKLRVQKATNQLENTNTPRRTRKDLARVLTVLRARQLGVEAAEKKETAG
jgi:large subunit ribosomal protein L29